ncbi:TIGR02206 family membrane protein [Bacillus lacus]|uniref:TIGR02206 family membrane protein n=2 Tax=Metabacillus lacus TaxID=1983721 RepID=A0A7X2LYT7_9BACI|nr:TIGR02206 family membrane protein [Metabacillus lacus]
MDAVGSEPFVMFSGEHIAAIVFFVMIILTMYLLRTRVKNLRLRTFETGLAISLIAVEALYYYWLISTGQWTVANSLPLELCSISLILGILLLLTGNRNIFDIVFFVGIGGAVQALLTPVLFVNFPHFRYFHFFYTHIGIIFIAFYYLWIKGYRPTFLAVAKTMLFLNLLLPVILLINYAAGGNYMFLSRKPETGSLLDYLGPYPWYILTLELAAFTIFLLLWLIFRERKKERVYSS